MFPVIMLNVVKDTTNSFKSEQYVNKYDLCSRRIVLKQF